jgi:hypothetical protein
MLFPYTKYQNSEYAGHQVGQNDAAYKASSAFMKPISIWHYFDFCLRSLFYKGKHLPKVHRYHAVRENTSINPNDKISHNYIISLILTIEILLAFLQKRSKL